MNAGNKHWFLALGADPKLVDEYFDAIDAWWEEQRMIDKKFRPHTPENSSAYLRELRLGRERHLPVLQKALLDLFDLSR